MKHIKKLLAVLLTVLLLTMGVGAAEALTYPDADQIDAAYTESVQVLSALEILQGFEDGTFRPAETITRGQMAKMIAVLDRGGEGDFTQTTGPFADVAANQWFAPYVNYCAETGIVAGVTANTFAPEGKVTGVQTAKMLLVYIGFDAEKEGYVGDSWRENVLEDAKRAGLLEGFVSGFDVDAPISRQEAAHMMANGLKAPVILESLGETLPG